MKYLISLFIICVNLSCVANSNYSEKCAKIGDTYKTVLSNCGDPSTTIYKNEEVTEVFYYVIFSRTRLYVSFNSHGIVDYISYSERQTTRITSSYGPDKTYRTE